MKRLQTLALEQKEDARHGDATFPIQKYITSLKPDYPVITTHWHEEAEFTPKEMPTTRSTLLPTLWKKTI